MPGCHAPAAACHVPEPVCPATPDLHYALHMPTPSTAATAAAPYTLAAHRGAACRYYVAEGVRTFSQDTWKQLFPEGGRDKVVQHIDAVVPYYIYQSKVCALALSRTSRSLCQRRQRPR